MSNNLALNIIEKQLLHCWIEHPELVFEDEIWVSENAKEFSFIILDLIDKGMSLIPEHILAESVEYVDEDSLQSIMETNYQLEKFDSYKKELSNKYLIQKFKDLNYDLNSDNVSDDEKLRLIEDNFDNFKKNQSANSENEGKTFSELVREHEKVIEKRAKGVKNSIGDFMFDRIMPNPSAGISILAGFSGSMKSTMCTHLAKVRIAKRMPTLFLNSELSLESYVDILTSSMIDEPIEDIMGMNNDDDHIDYDKIIEKLDFIADHYADKTKFLMYPRSIAYIKDLKPFILDARKRFEMKDDELIVFFIDLLSMLGDFQKEANLQNAIMKGLNTLNAIALETNCLIFGTTQLRKIESMQIKKLEDLNKFRVSGSQIKDSSEFYGRARYVFNIINPTNIVNTNYCDPIVKQLIEPVLTVYTVKSTYTDSLGKEANYYIDREHKALIPYEKDDSEEDTKVMPINLDTNNIKSYEG